MNRPSENGSADASDQPIAYGEPVISDLGSISELTLGTGGSSPDGGDSVLQRGGGNNGGL